MDGTLIYKEIFMYHEMRHSEAKQHTYNNIKQVRKKRGTRKG